MATLKELVSTGILNKIDPGLEPHELESRCLYGTTDFIEWLDNDLTTFTHDPIYADMTPMEQVSALFSEFILGINFSTDRRFKKLNRTPSFNVWELKTDDIRIFGWVPQKDHFICAFGDSATVVKDFSMYGAYMAKTKYVIDDLNLNEPKFLEGKEYCDVISNED